MNGLDLLAQAGTTFPTVVITGYGDIPMAVRAMQAGAIDFLTKPPREQDSLDAIHKGLAQHRVQLDHVKKTAGLHARVQSLSSREREILPLVTAGLMNKQLPPRLG
jgi:FixJ family two-component response regulator